MAFTAAETLSIAEMFGIAPTFLDAHITSLGADHITRVESRVRELLSDYDNLPTSWVKLHPKESNKGVETNPGSDAVTIRQKVAALLELTAYYATTYGMGTLQIGV